MTPSRIDLLIVGAGPVGLTLACEALRHGLQPRLIDLAEGPSIHSKAQIVHARTLELLEDMGIVERFLERGLKTRAFTMYDEGAKRRVARFEIGEVGARFSGMLSISQVETERLLAERVAELAGAIERGVKLDSFQHDDAGVCATLEHLEDGRREQLRVPYLVGCDGAHSAVRHGLGLAFEGSRYPMNVIQTDARVDFPFPVPDDEVTGFVSPKAIAGFFPLPDGEHRYRFLVPLGGVPASEATPAQGYATKMSSQPTLERFQEILDEIAPPGSTVSDPKWIVGFHIHCRLAERFRVGRVFLAGDAGHIHSPAGGQGMNMGMQDAHNLAWKLALVHRGEGCEALLDSYEEERRQVAAETLAWTDRATRGGLINFGIQNKLAVALRNRLASFVTSLGVVQERASRTITMIDVAYEASSICGEHRSSLLDANLVTDRSTEQPSIRSWASFGSGPAPGHRAADAHLDPDDPDSARVHELLWGTAHTLLLFDGAADTAEGYAKLRAIESRVAARYGERVRTHIIVPHEEVPAELAKLESAPGESSIVLDAAGAYHEAYGAKTECLYLIRPDGYVGYRCQPADERSDAGARATPETKTPAHGPG